MVLRIIVVLVTMAALHQLLGAVTPATEAAIAFMVGFFPVIAFQALQRAAAATLRVFVPQMTLTIPSTSSTGSTSGMRPVGGGGIEDMQNLATANLVDVILHTRVPVGRLVDWVDQAKLYRTSTGPSAATTSDGSSGRPKSQQSTTIARLPPTGSHQRATVRTRRPRRRPITGRLPAIRRHPHRATCTPMIHSCPWVAESPQPCRNQDTVALRQLGIRTATDLLKAFHPSRSTDASTTTAWTA